MRFLKFNSISATFLIIFATLAALVLANSPLQETYLNLSAHVIKIPWIGIDLSIADWAASGLLAVFFFVVGLELKHEFVVTNSKNLSSIFIPILAAIFGVITPALIYLLINSLFTTHFYSAWAIPTATDITFAISALAVIAPHISSRLKNFLLTLAVADDLIAILIIIFKYATGVNFIYLLISIIPLLAFYILTNKGVTNIFLLLPLAIIFWALWEKSQVHPTIAGVVLGLTVPIRSHSKSADGKYLNRYFYKRIEKFSSLLVVPVFAFLAAGVNLGGLSGLVNSFTSPITLGVTLGLLVGKPVGIFTTCLVSRNFTNNDYFTDNSLRDLWLVSCLAGIGFTVSLLLSKMSFLDLALQQQAKVGVLAGSLLAMVSTGILTFFAKKSSKVF